MSVSIVKTILPSKVETVTFLGYKEGRTWKGFFYKVFQFLCRFPLEDGSVVTLEDVKKGYATPDFFAKKAIEDLQVLYGECGENFDVMEKQLTAALKTQSFWAETFPTTDLGFSLTRLGVTWFFHANRVCEVFEKACGEDVCYWNEEDCTLSRFVTSTITSRKQREDLISEFSQGRYSSSISSMQQMLKYVEGIKKEMGEQAMKMQKKMQSFHDAGLILFPERWETDLQRVVLGYDISKLLLSDIDRESTSILQQEMKEMNNVLNTQKEIFIQYCGGFESFPYFDSKDDEEIVKAALFPVYKNVRHEGVALEYDQCTIEVLRGAIRRACKTDNRQAREANIQEIGRLREQLFCLEPRFLEAFCSLREVAAELQRLQSLDKGAYLAKVEEECHSIQGLLDLPLEEGVFPEGSSIEDKLMAAVIKWRALKEQISYKTAEVRENLGRSALQASRMKGALGERATGVQLVNLVGFEDMPLQTLKGKKEEMTACLAALNMIEEEQRQEMYARAIEAKIVQCKEALQERNELIEELKLYVHVNNQLLVSKAEPGDWSSVDVSEELQDCLSEITELKSKLGLVVKITQKEAYHASMGATVDRLIMSGDSTIEDLEEHIRYLDDLSQPASIWNGLGIFWG